MARKAGHSRQPAAIKPIGKRKGNAMSKPLKLGHIYNAREALQRLAGLRVPPLFGYRLMRYLKRVSAEGELIEAQRQKLIRECAGADAGAEVSLKAGTPEYGLFVEQFGAMLDGPVDLEPMPLKFDVLIKILEEGGNAVSIQDLAVLEPFFEGEGT